MRDLKYMTDSETIAKIQESLKDSENHICWWKSVHSNRSSGNLEIAHELHAMIKGDGLHYSTRDLLKKCIYFLVGQEAYMEHFSDLGTDFVNRIWPPLEY